MLGKIFEPFVNKSPVSVMARGLAERLLQPEKLDAWFESLDTAQYTRDLLFSSVFNLMSQVVCGSQKSVNAAYQAAKDEIGTSIVSVYNKLKCMDINTSANLVPDMPPMKRSPIIEQLGGTLPSLLPGYRVKLLDGNCIEASEHRLKELRNLAAGPYPANPWSFSIPRCTSPSMYFPVKMGMPKSVPYSARCLKSVAPRDVWVASVETFVP